MNDTAEIIGSENARVSAAIIIPAFNAAATIVETLRAVQGCPGVAKLGGVFVCDDASTDNTSKLAADAWISMPKLTIMQNEQQLGQHRTVNAAFERLRKHYEWIFILHADDVVKKNWLDLYFPRIMAAEPRVASICSSYDSWYFETNRIDRGEDDFGRNLEIIRGTRKSVLGTLKAGCWWHISGCAIRVERFLRLADSGRIWTIWPTLSGCCVVSSWAMTSNTFHERLCSIACTQRLFRQSHSGVGRISLSGWKFSGFIATRAI